MNREGWRGQLDLAAGPGMPFHVVPGLAARVAQLVPISSANGGRATTATQLSLVPGSGPLVATGA